MKMNSTKKRNRMKKKSWSFRPQKHQKRKVNIRRSWRSYSDTISYSKRSKTTMQFRKWWLMLRLFVRIAFSQLTPAAKAPAVQSLGPSPCPRAEGWRRVQFRERVVWANMTTYPSSVQVAKVKPQYRLRPRGWWIIRIRCRRRSKTNSSTSWSLDNAKSPALTSRFWPSSKGSPKSPWRRCYKCLRFNRESCSRSRSPRHLVIMTKNTQTMLAKSDTQKSARKAPIAKRLERPEKTPGREERIFLLRRRRM